MKTFFARRFLWFCLIWLAPAIGSAQNLVPNYSFEDYNRCPTEISQFEVVTGWMQANAGTTDYYNVCASGRVNVPNGALGYQQPHFGKGYAGFIPYEPGTAWREYAQVKLIKPLEEGTVYHVEFFVSRVEKISTANIGAYFSVFAPSSSASGLLDNVTRPPQVRNRSGLLTDTLNWMKIEGNFAAAGGEQYLTIGNFDDNNRTYISSDDGPFAYYYLDDVSVEVASCPIVTDLGPDVVLCPGESMLLDATSKGASYQWQDGSTRPSYEVTSPGMYWVEVKLGTCSFRDTIKVDYLDQLPIDRLKDTILCTSQNFFLNATFPGAVGYHWQDGSGKSSQWVTMSGIYWVDIDFGGCVYRDSIKIEYRDQINKVPDYTTVCQGTSVLLDATTEGASYIWQDGSTKPTFMATRPGFYSVAIQLGSCTYYDYAQVNAYYYPEIFSQKQMALCKGGTTVLDASSVSGPYRWQNNSTESSLVVDKPGTYWVEFYYESCLVRDSIEIHYLDHLPSDRLKDTLLCANEYYYLLDATFPEAIGYRWQDGSTWPSRSVSSPGAYWVDIEFAGCTYRDSVNITYQDKVNQLPAYVSMCQGEAVVLDATTRGATYRWQDGSTNSTFTTTKPGYYSVLIQVGTCSYYNYVQVENNYYPQIFSQERMALCKGGTTVLDASSVSGPYRWQDNSTESTFTVREAGTYWVEFYYQSCLVRESIKIDDLVALPGDLLKDTTLCTTQYVLLDAYFPGAIGYHWQDGSTWPSRLFSTAGTYWVDVEFAGCTYRDSVRVTFIDQINQLPSILQLCDGQPIVLDATMPGATYLWQNGSTSSTFTATKPGYYSVEVQVGTCTFYQYVQVVMYNIPQLFSSRDLTICRGSTTFLDASVVNGPYEWSNGSTDGRILVNEAGTYRVKFYWYGCVLYDSVTVRYPEDPPLPFPKEISLCQGQSMVLDASSLNSWYYQWSTGNSGAILQVSQPGTYSLVASWNNCSIQFSTTVSMFPNPVVTIKNDTTLCYGRSLVLQAVGDNQRFRWSDNSAGAFLTVQQPGAYWLEVEDKTTGCTSRKTIEISQTECWEELVIPNVITPHNGDALNQAFVIDRLTDHWSLEIVNRWGTSVYQTTSYRNDWQGNGQVGLYYYILRNTVSGQAYRGWLQVLQ